MQPPRSKIKKRKKATAEMCTPTLGTLAVDREPPLSKKKKLNQNLNGLPKPSAPNLYSKSTPSIRAKGKVMPPVRSASRRRCISRPCKQQGSNVLLSADASSALSRARRSPMLPRAELVAPAHRLRSTWTKPEMGQLKLNFDGSCKGQSKSKSAIGGVYRDHNGKFVLGYAGRIHKATSSVTELVALKRGLELALENGWRDISVEGDFKPGIDVIASCARFRAKNAKELEQCTAITAMLPWLGKVTLTHVGREGNQVADHFAKLGHEETVERVWHGVPPAEVLLHLQRDAEVPSKKKKNEEEKKKRKRDAEVPSKKKKNEEEKKKRKRDAEVPSKKKKNEEEKKKRKRDAVNPSKKKKNEEEKKNRKRDAVNPSKKKKNEEEKKKRKRDAEVPSKKKKNEEEKKKRKRDAEVPSKKKKNEEEKKKKRKRDAKDPSKKKKDDEEKNPKKNRKRDAVNPSKNKNGAKKKSQKKKRKGDAEGK